MHKLLISLFICIIVICGTKVGAQDIEVLSIDELEQRFEEEHETLTVYNFWATWCRPCVAELPYFEQLQARYQDQQIKVVLVSLDFVEDLPKRVRPFVKKKKLKSEVILLDESGNKWIDRVSPEWSGAIPATLLVMPEKEMYEFSQQEFTYEELQAFIFETMEAHGIERPE